MTHTTEVVAIFVIFLPILAKNWLLWQHPLDPCNQKCLFGLANHKKNPVIRNHILVISCTNAFIAIFVPKLVVIVTPLCPLCTGVSHINSLIAQTLSQNQTLHGYVVYNWSYGNFCDVWPILAKIWLPWQRPLEPCNQKCLLWIGRPRKPPITTNRILVISHTNALYAFIAMSVPKLVDMVTPFVPCVWECHTWIPR